MSVTRGLIEARDSSPSALSSRSSRADVEGSSLGGRSRDPFAQRLRCEHLGSVGLIGSAAKWRRFEKGLRVEGHSEERIARIRCPIGVPDLMGKDPATIAVGVAADLLRAFESSRVTR